MCGIPGREFISKLTSYPMLPDSSFNSLEGAQSFESFYTSLEDTDEEDRYRTTEENAARESAKIQEAIKRPWLICNPWFGYYGHHTVPVFSCDADKGVVKTWCSFKGMSSTNGNTFCIGFNDLPYSIINVEMEYTSIEQAKEFEEVLRYAIVCQVAPRNEGKTQEDYYLKESKTHTIMSNSGKSVNHTKASTYNHYDRVNRSFYCKNLQVWVYHASTLEVLKKITTFQECLKL